MTRAALLGHGEGGAATGTPLGRRRYARDRSEYVDSLIEQARAAQEYSRALREQSRSAIEATEARSKYVRDRH